MLQHKIISLYQQTPLEITFKNGEVCIISKNHPIFKKPYFEALLNSGFKESHGKIDFSSEDAPVTKEIWDVLVRTQESSPVFSCGVSQDNTTMVVFEETLQLELSDTQFFDVLVGADYFCIDTRSWIAELCKKANSVFSQEEPREDGIYSYLYANLLWQFVTVYKPGNAIFLDRVVKAFPNLEELCLLNRDLTGIVVPESFGDIKRLYLSNAKNIPAGLIAKALEAGVEEIGVSVCDLRGVVVPESLAGIKKLYFSHAKNTPEGLSERVRELGGVVIE